MLSGMRSLRKPRELLIGCRKSIPCLRLADRIANVFKAEDFQKAFDTLADRNSGAGKVVLTFA